MLRSRFVSFEDWPSKASWLDGAATRDARWGRVREVARRFALACPPNDPQALAEELFAFVKLRIRYIHDPASEEFSDSDTVLAQGYGDCDDKVRLFVALCRSVQLEARILPVISEASFVHVQAQVRWPGSYHYPGAGLGGWVDADVILSKARLGDQVQDVPDHSL